jgi:hypothetical protein
MNGFDCDTIIKASKTDMTVGEEYQPAVVFAVYW